MIDNSFISTYVIYVIIKIIQLPGNEVASKRCVNYTLTLKWKRTDMVCIQLAEASALAV